MLKPRIEGIRLPPPPGEEYPPEVSRVPPGYKGPVVWIEDTGTFPAGRGPRWGPGPGGLEGPRPVGPISRGPGEPTRRPPIPRGGPGPLTGPRPPRPSWRPPRRPPRETLQEVQRRNPKAWSGLSEETRSVILEWADSGNLDTLLESSRRDLLGYGYSEEVASELHHWVRPARFVF